MNSILLEDIENVLNDSSIDFNKLENKKILITGATGLIGRILIKVFKNYNEMHSSKIKLLLLVRSVENAEKIFGIDENIEYIEQSVEKYIPQNIAIDYIIHMASPTKSNFFIQYPVETLETIACGTKKILEQAKISKVKSFVYLSSMEMYGTINDSDVTEDKLGYINNLEERSSYSEGKRYSELLAYSYFKEYEVPVKIARLAQTFGAGISKNENRVYKMFCDSILKKEDIILKTKGSTIVNFCYTTDAIKGILKILLEGTNGQAYNIASDNMHMTILDCANWLVEKYTNNEIKVKFEINPKAFAPDNKMILNNDKIKAIGWEAKYNVLQGYERLIEYLKEENNEE